MPAEGTGRPDGRQGRGEHDPELSDQGDVADQNLGDEQGDNSSMLH
jgi:hypothetical protein